MGMAEAQINLVHFGMNAGLPARHRQNQGGSSGKFCGIFNVSPSSRPGLGIIWLQQSRSLDHYGKFPPSLPIVSVGLAEYSSMKKNCETRPDHRQ